MKKHNITSSARFLCLLLLAWCPFLMAQQQLTRTVTESELVAGRFPTISPELLHSRFFNGDQPRTRGETQTLEDYLVEQLMACASEIDVKDYKIPWSDNTDVYFSILNKHPELFHVRSSCKCSGIYDGSVKGYIVK